MHLFWRDFGKLQNCDVHWFTYTSTTFILFSLYRNLFRNFGCWVWRLTQYDQRNNYSNFKNYTWIQRYMVWFINLNFSCAKLQRTLLFVFVGSYSGDVLGQLIKTMTNLLMSNEREIVKSALGFFKVRSLCEVCLDGACSCSRY